MSRVLPILFNTEMVKAILDGRKTVTRRVIKPQPTLNGRLWVLDGAAWSDGITTVHPMPCHSLYNRASYQPGNILYVRETWRMRNVYGDFTRGGRFVEIEFRAGGDFSHMRISEDVLYGNAWHPSIHMPKKAARIWLKVANVRVERLASMSLDDFLSEGVCILPEAFNDPENAYMQARNEFIGIWDSTISKRQQSLYGWGANPWVWVIEFERCRKPEEEK